MRNEISPIEGIFLFLFGGGGEGACLAFLVKTYFSVIFSLFQMARLEEARNECLIKSLLIIQSCWRRYKRKLTKQRKAAAVTIQSGECLTVVS